jgi:putative nucleotidyltransferase with HDIG domain
MAKAKPTLFAQLKNEEALENPNEPTGIRFSRSVKITIIVATLLITTVFFPSKSGIDYSNPQSGNAMLGLTWPDETLKADFTFPIYKPQAAYLTEIERARMNTPPVFVVNAVTPRIAARNADGILSALNAVNVASSQTSSQIPLSESATTKFLQIDVSQRNKLLDRIDHELLKLLTIIYQNGFLNVNKSKFTATDITIKLNNIQEQRLPNEKFIDSTAFPKIAEKIFTNSLPINEAEIAADIAKRAFIPNLIYSEQATEEDRKLAAASVAKTIGIVRAGEIIISKGERITEDALLKIQSSGKSRLLHGAKDISWVIVLGNLGHSASIYLILLMYLFFIRRTMFDDNLQLAGLSGMMIFVGCQAWLTMHINVGFPIEFAVVLPALSMLFAILFDSRTGFYATVAMAVLLAGIRGNDYPTAIAMMLAGMFGAYTVRDLQNRTQIFKSIFSVFLGFALPIIALAAERTVEFSTVGSQLIVALMNSAISPLITFGLLFIVERVFHITTDLLLQEYDNLDHPLLVELSEKAPGTYQHTLTIARLAESAARAINANDLLVKVGAYFHDIGKVAKSEYFIENQINISNKHDKLSPKKSAQVIKNHIEEGIELAHEYKLPKRIIDFIATHHGTMLIKHFYAKAIEDAETNPADINEDDFRYPGPKPATKETAIVMLADAAEAITRANNNDEREDFENTLDAIIKERLLDGQFDNCDITMHELQIIKETFVKNLIGIHHHRIQYKTIAPEDKEAK